MRSILILCILILVSACGPSEADIAAAIAETEASKPTATVEPTFTPVPTAIPIPLRDLVINYHNITEVGPDIAKMWEKQEIETNCMRDYQPDHECSAISFLPNTSFAKPLVIQLVRFGDSNIATEENESARKTAELRGHPVFWNFGIKLPDSLWFAVIGDRLQAGFAQNDLNFMVWIYALPGEDADYWGAYIALLVQQQVARIEDAIE